MSDINILTVTLEPTLDRTLTIRYLAEGYHNLTHAPTRLDPAGEGINISRALHRLGVRTHAIILLGDDATGRAYEALVSQETFEISIIKVKGQTKSTTIILDAGKGVETQIIENNDGIKQNDLQLVADQLKMVVKPDDIVVLTGTLPINAPTDIYATLVDVVHNLGAEAVVISRGEALKKALNANPDLIVMSQVEMEVFFNFPVRLTEDILGCAQHIRDQGAVRSLVIMKDAGNALLITNEEEWFVELPDVEIASSSGVWDALLAGFLAGRVNRRPIKDSLELGAAAATYTTSQIGSKFGSLDEVKELTDDVDVTEIEDKEE